MSPEDMDMDEHQRCPLFPKFRLEEISGLRIARLINVRNQSTPQAWEYPEPVAATYTREDLEKDHGGGEYELTALSRDLSDKDVTTIRIMGQPLDSPWEQSKMGNNRFSRGGGGGFRGGPSYPMDGRGGGRYDDDDDDDDDRGRRPAYQRSAPTQPTSIPLDGNSMPVVPGVSGQETLAMGFAMQLMKSEKENAANAVQHARELAELQKQSSLALEDRLGALRRENDSLTIQMQDMRRSFADLEQQQRESNKRSLEIERSEVERLRTQLHKAEEQIILLEREISRLQAEAQIGKMTREAEARLDELRKKVDSASGAEKDELRKQQFMQMGAALIQSDVGIKFLRAIGLGDVAGVFASGATGASLPGAAAVP